MKKTLSLLLALVMLFSLGISAFAADAPAEETDALVVDTMILKESDDNMINNYTLLAVNPRSTFCGCRWECRRGCGAQHRRCRCSDQLASIRRG